ncbi:FKBP-type peptidyl-prolyl cis-trans isomerase [Undibacterium sp. CY18W]|uniref:Peptidyl-prolyl cis-trans isomerase n=1 Tax=Undibacterium hunanense TaxID=2762292 RepID=A0ABR6ZKS0_9BURK|nr:FKBP-type peptidyl-prolyl cis-trans isomerase [Undibacterium hunanense]MBC3916505.1 FKBP-type peptidyl-prolyl cis-trans isomerase [Undibacterium hunanense]
MKSRLLISLLATSLLQALPVHANPAPETPAQSQATEASVPAPAEGPSVQKIDLVVGKGFEAIAGRNVVVHYTGWLHDPFAKQERGKLFDSSKGRGTFSFVLGAGRVIKGWEQGVAGMRVGGKRTLIIPPELAYGAKGAGNGLIPPNAQLIFDIELLDVK